MNISSKPLSVHSGEKLYRQQNPVIQKQNQIQQQKNTVDKINNLQVTGKTVSVEKVLTSREVDTLNALFFAGKETDSGLYGRSKVQNIHSGYLLDIKG